MTCKCCQDQDLFCGCDCSPESWPSPKDAEQWAMEERLRRNPVVQSRVTATLGDRQLGILASYGEEAEGAVESLAWRKDLHPDMPTLALTAINITLECEEPLHPDIQEGGMGPLSIQMLCDDMSYRRHNFENVLIRKIDGKRIECSLIGTY